MTTITSQEVNHLVAIRIKNWVHDEDIFYHDGNGTTQYLADYCNSIAHALDLANAHDIGLAPSKAGWTAYSVNDANVSAEDALPGKAICLCVLKMFDDSDSQKLESEPVVETPEVETPSENS